MYLIMFCYYLYFSEFGPVKALMIITAKKWKSWQLNRLKVLWLKA